MSNEKFDLMIPDKSELPAYVLDKDAARAANEDASAGISTGIPARIKASGTKFMMVDGNGEEKPFPPSKLITGPDENVYLPMIVLRAKKAITKVWYAAAYNKDAEGQAPDCFSNDGERPDASIQNPQCETCANCPQNAFGSGKDQNGNPTKGKACSDNKILAVFVPGFGVHSLKIMPTSLKNWGLYVKQLSANHIPVDKVKTLVGFDPAASYPVYIFRYGGFVPEQGVPKLLELQESVETEEIITGVINAAPAAVAPPAKQVEQAPPPPNEEPKQETADDLGLGDDDMGLGLTEAAPPKEEAKTEPADDMAGVADDELAKELGL